MAGRRCLLKVVPLTVRELENSIGMKAHDYYLRFGGLPGVVNKKNQQERMHHRNLGNELKKSKKYYLYDIGIRNALIKDFRGISQREDKGSVLESAVYLGLTSNLMPNEDLKFWRTRDGQEVDFILIRDRQPIPIEVKTNLRKLDVPAGLEAFLRKYPNVSKAYVANNSLEGEMIYGKTHVKFIHWSKCTQKAMK